MLAGYWLAARKHIRYIIFFLIYITQLRQRGQQATHSDAEQELLGETQERESEAISGLCARIFRNFPDARGAGAHYGPNVAPPVLTD